MKVIRAEVLPYRLPLRAPMESSRGAATERLGVLLLLEDDAGRRGWGDAAPIEGFGTDLTAVRRTLDMLLAPTGGLIGRSVRSLSDVRAVLSARPLPVETAHALELALLDLLGQSLGQSVGELLTQEPRSVVEIHARVSTAAEAQAAVKRGARALKIKIGAETLDQDVARVGAIREVAGRDVKLRLDANGAWERDAALTAARALAAFDPEWIEQPVAARDLEGLALVRQQAGVRVAVDEGVQRLEDLEKVISLGAADVLVIKPQFCGGPSAAQRLAERAWAAGLGVTVTHAVESCIGRVGAMHLAAALSGPIKACGLADPPLAADVAKAPVATGGWVDVPSEPGLGVDAMEWVRKQRAARPPASGTGEAS